MMLEVHTCEKFRAIILFTQYVTHIFLILQCIKIANKFVHPHPRSVQNMCCIILGDDH